MNILGIDIGAHTGIAIGQFPDPTRPAEGCLAMTCATWDLDPKASRPLRLAVFMRHLQDLLITTDHEADAVAAVLAAWQLIVKEVK